jgi:hypothetical protein
VRVNSTRAGQFLKCGGDARFVFAASDLGCDNVTHTTQVVYLYIWNGTPSSLPRHLLEASEGVIIDDKTYNQIGGKK